MSVCFFFFRDPNSGYDGSSVEDAQLPFWDSYDHINQFYLEIGEVPFTSRAPFHSLPTYMGPDTYLRLCLFHVSDE
jgi:hypothetical protein